MGGLTDDVGVGSEITEKRPVGSPGLTNVDTGFNHLLQETQHQNFRTDRADGMSERRQDTQNTHGRRLQKETKGLRKVKAVQIMGASE